MLVPETDLSTVSATIADLPDLALGAELNGAIEVDPTAAGWGWGTMDLLTVVLVGSSNTREVVRGTHRFVYTPRGYAAKHATAEALPGDPPEPLACR